MNPIHVKVSSLDQAACFFKDVVGAEIEEVVLDKKRYLLVKHGETAQLLLSDIKNPLQTQQILLRTADCLEDYCRLKTRGVVFKMVPAYFDKGLKAVFSDPYGNDYTLLEERIYSET